MPKKRLVKIFVSYSSKDKDSLQKLITYLAQPYKNKIFVLYTDRGILTGDHLPEGIQYGIDSADMVIFLVSATFIASPNCIYEWEEAIRQRKVLLPVVVKPCLRETLLTGKYNYKALPYGDESIAEYLKPAVAWVRVCREIVDRIKRFRPPRDPSVGGAPQARKDRPTRFACATESRGSDFLCSDHQSNLSGEEIALSLTICGGSPSVGLGIIAEEADSAALFAGLNNHSKSGLFDIFNKVVVFHRGISTADLKDIKKSFRVQTVEMPANITGAERMEAFTKGLDTDYILLLKHDSGTAATVKKIRGRLKAAIGNIKADKVQYYLTDGEVLRTLNAGRRIGRYVNIPFEPVAANNPVWNGGYWLLPVHMIEWSDVGALFPRQWFQQELLPALKREDKDEESPINLRDHRDLAEISGYSRWWLEQDIAVGMINEELFTSPAPAKDAMMLPPTPESERDDGLGYAYCPDPVHPDTTFSAHCVIIGSGISPKEYASDEKVRKIVRQVEHLCKNCYPSAWSAEFEPPELSGSADSKGAQVRKWLGLQDNKQYDFDTYRSALESKGVLIIHSEDAPNRWQEGHPLSASFSELGRDAWKVEHPFFLALATGSVAPLIYVRKAPPKLEVRALFHALWRVLPSAPGGIYSGSPSPHIIHEQKEQEIRRFAYACLPPQ